MVTENPKNRVQSARDQNMAFKGTTQSAVESSFLKLVHVVEVLFASATSRTVFSSHPPRRRWDGQHACSCLEHTKSPANRIADPRQGARARDEPPNDPGRQANKSNATNEGGVQYREDGGEWEHPDTNRPQRKGAQSVLSVARRLLERARITTGSRFRGTRPLTAA